MVLNSIFTDRFLKQKYKLYYGKFLLTVILLESIVISFKRYSCWSRMLLFIKGLC